MSRTDLGQIIDLSYAAIKIAALPAFIFAQPIRTSHIEFAHIDAGLTITAEESSPSIALLEDERIPILKVVRTDQSHAKSMLLVGEKDMTRDVESLLTAKRGEIRLKIESTEVAQNTPILLASSIVQYPSTHTAQPEASVSEIKPATTGEKVPAFGEAFRANTVPKGPGSDQVPPSNDDVLIDTMTASRTPVISFRKLANANTNQKSPWFKQVIENGEAPAAKDNLQAVHSVKSYEGESAKNEVLNGLVELTKGLAVTDRHKLKVSLAFASHEIEQATVDLSTGTYSIKRPQDDSGMLVAELVDPHGRLIGKGESHISEVLKDPTRRLYVTPIFGALFGSLNDVYQKPTPGADIRFTNTDVRTKSDKAGKYKFESVMADSQVILSTSKEGYWGSRLVAETASPLDINLFPNRMIEALHELVGVEVDINKGIIWGKVESGGRPTAGATVEMSDANSIGPIYFNQLMLPDKNLKQTSANGLFAYLKVYPGVHAIKTINMGREYPSRIVSVDSANVSSIRIESLSTAAGRILVYDALDGEPLEASVRIAGTEKEAMTNEGQIGVRYYKGSDLMFVEADAGATHYVGRITVPRVANVFKMPMIRKAWLNELSGQARVSRHPSAGVVVGFVQGEDFTIGLPSHLVSAEVLYFDSMGRFSGRQTGQSGGGFVIFNVEAGLQQISVLPLDGEGFASKVIHSDSSGVHLLNVKF